jgi:hypothetical protein
MAEVHQGHVDRDGARIITTRKAVDQQQDAALIATRPGAAGEVSCSPHAAGDAAAEGVDQPLWRLVTVKPSPKPPSRGWSVRDWYSAVNVARAQR